MQTKKDDNSYLWDMACAAEWISKFLAEKKYYHFEQDELLRSAVERKVEIIGEAARNVSINMQITHSEIQWKRIIGLRHLLAHEYGEIKYEILWVIVTRDIPELVQLIKPILELIPSEDIL